MSVKEFPSKIDAWLGAVLALALLMQLGLLVWMLYSTGNGMEKLVMAAVSAVVFLLVLSILAHTRYRVGTDMLTIVSGPFRWKVPLAEIESVEPSRNPLSSPALSMDRLKIRYSGKKKILVSPADKKGFIKALQQ